HVRAYPELDPVDVGFSLATTRAALAHRAGLLVRDREDALAELARLAAFLGDADPPASVRGVAGEGRLAVLFTGQGSQRPGMGWELYQVCPAFAGAFDLACRHLDPHLDRPLREVVFADAGTEAAALLDRTGFTQPALFALEVALYRLLESWGVRPDYLLG